MSVMRAVIALALLVGAAPAAAQTAADSSAIRATALDYIDGWWAGDAKRMSASLHPELVKRIRNTASPGQRDCIVNQGASRLIDGTLRGGGRQTPTAERKSDVRILDIFQNTASVRVDAGGWVDYMHIVKWSGRWVIINVLWETKRRP